ncbi:hypothetical protein C7Y66_24515 [Chroococcidiopsis sp. CCALA 051]|nr:hypothetical protein C7Y66_24515 [Chroococcidiopsis sp. CCALA 051]
MEKSTTLITKLTPEQEALILVYQEKWKEIAFSTERIDRQKAAEAVKAIYNIEQSPKEPEILFFDSPYGALSVLDELLATQSLKIIGNQLLFQLENKIKGQLDDQFEIQIRCQLDSNFKQVVELLSSLVAKQIPLRKRGNLSYSIPYYSSSSGIVSELYLDFCFSVLNCTCDREKWSVFQSLSQHCGWVYFFEETCIICNRPSQIRFDSEGRIHGEGEPAIQFADGFSVYAYHGDWIPEKYGQISPKEWQSQWLLETEDAELRQVLIQEIGYTRMCQELDTIQLDTWQEYTLLKIHLNEEIDRFFWTVEPHKQPIHLLIITDSSTGSIHVRRVSPEINSVREAIGSVDWSTDSEEFRV